MAALLKKLSKRVGEPSPRFEKITKTDEEWEKILSQPTFLCMRQEKMEHPFKGKYYDFALNGRYGYFSCKACDFELYDAADFVATGRGWPGFTEPFPNHTRSEMGTDGIVTKTKHYCAKCDGYLGINFENGHMVNSQCIKFVQLESEAAYKDKMKTLKPKKK